MPCHRIANHDCIISRSNSSGMRSISTMLRTGDPLAVFVFFMFDAPSRSERSSSGSWRNETRRQLFALTHKIIRQHCKPAHQAKRDLEEFEQQLQRSTSRHEKH